MHVIQRQRQQQFDRRSRFDTSVILFHTETANDLEHEYAKTVTQSLLIATSNKFPHSANFIFFIVAAEGQCLRKDCRCQFLSCRKHHKITE